MKVQVLYPVYELDSSAKRKLELSIETIKKQNTKHKIEICVSDGSLFKTNIRGVNKIYHDFCGTKINKPKIINNGFDNLITEDFFFLSDIDLLYPPDYIDYMIKNLNENNRILYYPVVRTATEPYGRMIYGESISEEEALKAEREVMKNGNFEELINKKKFMVQHNLGLEREISKNLPVNNLVNEGLSSPAVLINSKLFDKLGGFDEMFVGMPKEERDFMFRAYFKTKPKVVNKYGDNKYVYHLYHKDVADNLKNNISYFKYKVENYEDV